MRGRSCLRLEPGFGWRVTGGGTWRDEVGSAWHGNPLDIELTLPAGTSGTLYLCVSDWNALGRRGRILVEGREHTLGEHEGLATWLALEVTAADTQDGRVMLRLRPSAGPNLMVRELAFVARQ